MQTVLTKSEKIALLDEAGFPHNSKLPSNPNREKDGSIYKNIKNCYNNYTTENTNNQAFSELILFDTSDDLPLFPVNSLPRATAEFIMKAAENIQAPLEMVGSCVLGVLAIACNGRYPVRLPNGHIERPCFYIAPIAPPSERKSGVIDVVIKPLIEYEIEYNQAHNAEVNQSKSDLKLLHGKISNAEQIAIKEKDIEKRKAAEQELQALNAELAEFEPIEQLRLFSADVTPEKLAAMLKAQGGTFALVSAEGGGLFENIGRYCDKGGLEIYLNGYSGDRICVDRKSSESIVIDKPTLSLIAPCQPSVVSELFSDKQKAGRGLLSRILFVKCKSRVGTRKATSTALDDRIKSNYNNLCRNMLIETSKGELTFDNEAFQVYVNFFNEIEPQLTPDIGELSFIGEWAGKLHGNMIRFSGFVHCINAFEQGNNPLDTKITATEATAAVMLSKFFLAHAKEVYSQQEEPLSISNVRYLWSKLKSIKSISKRDLIRKTQGKQDFNLDESLSLLVEHGYIIIEQTNTGMAGRPSETIFINPETEITMT